MEQMTVLPFSREHLPAWLENVRAGFSDAWSQAQMEAELETPNTCHFALMTGETLAGYGGMYYVLDEGTITNIAVAPEYRRRGGGGLLLDAMIERAKALSLALLMLEVRSSNEPAVALYASRGFERVGRRKNYYRHPDEDALLMTRLL